MKTYNPTLDSAVLDRLRDYAALFADEFPQSQPARWAGVYLRGLLLDGGRKSIEPLSRRTTRSDGLTSLDPEQALQQFVNQSPWDEKAVLTRYRAHLAQTFASPEGIFPFDDVSFPEQGTHSVGVQRQYCGASGKKANGQVAVSAHYASPGGHDPPDLQLYLPDSWLSDTKRPDNVGVPEGQRQARTKHEIALELLDRVRGEGLPGHAVVADAGYGVSGVFRAGLEQRAWKYVVGVTADFVVFTEEPERDRPGTGNWGRGRPRKRSQLAASSPRPVAVSASAGQVPLRRVGWREGTKGTLPGHFARVRVWPGQGWATGDCADAQPLWLLLEKQGGDGPLTFAFSNLPAGTSRLAAVGLWKSRWPVEQGYQRLKEELGLDHFEGRSWRGFHHHAAMTLSAYGFLLLERRRLTVERERKKAARPTRAKKGVPSQC